jgi:hypothetical protein
MKTVLTCLKLCCVVLVGTFSISYAQTPPPQELPKPQVRDWRNSPDIKNGIVSKRLQKAFEDAERAQKDFIPFANKYEYTRGFKNVKILDYRDFGAVPAKDVIEEMHKIKAAAFMVGIRAEAMDNNQSFYLNRATFRNVAKDAAVELIYGEDLEMRQKAGMIFEYYSRNTFEMKHNTTRSGGLALETSEGDSSWENSVIELYRQRDSLLPRNFDSAKLVEMVDSSVNNVNVFKTDLTGLIKYYREGAEISNLKADLLEYAISYGKNKGLKIEVKKSDKAVN